ncbi:MAG: flagellar FlbD family protein [Acidimicrobiales bacterium]
MILLTRFHGGEQFAVNPDLIERAEATPDTVITLTNGTKHVVQESIDEITERIQIYKAATLAIATRMVDDPSPLDSGHLSLVHDSVDGDEESPDHSGPRRP